MARVSPGRNIEHIRSTGVWTTCKSQHKDSLGNEMFKKMKTRFTASALAAFILVSTIVTVTGTSIPVGWWLTGSAYIYWRGGW